MVGDGLEHQLALDLEHVADVVEDPGQVPVGELARRLVVVGRIVRVAIEVRLGLEGGSRRLEARAGIVRHSGDGSRYAATTRSRPPRFAR